MRTSNNFFFIILFLASLLYLKPCKGLELRRVILATDENKLYIEFWPSVAKTWSAMGFRPTLALISEKNCVDTTIGDVIRFDPIPGFSTAMQAQVYRLFLPALFPKDGCIISDMDLIPTSKEYLVDNAKPYSDKAFLVYRDAALPGEKQYPMCYVAAKGNIFGSIFKIKDKSDFANRLEECKALYDRWETDQLILYQWVNEWANKGGNVVKLGHTVSHRLDRASWKTTWQPNEIDSSIDAHCPRPYSQYQDSIDAIVQRVLKKYGST